MDKFARMSRAWQRDVQNFDVNKRPLSDTMSAGSPCLENTSRTNIVAKVGAVSMVRQGMKMPCFDSLSTTTSMASKLLDSGRVSMWSIEIEVQGLSPMGNGLSSPYGLWRELFVRWQVWQLRM